ncbi:ABC transporter ATP-binding protein [Nocardioides albus]|uniref:Oligopeptide/dipeptide ABC transporter ATP-binding protein n=1 Tax=Nocardioides albus TaxID=1841 RepID=A0A7W5A3I5_9ACTN|nr:oligopeptide/dipeptide ABC transporter ATP-binding protein [Nocardioides albus]MBB3088997.1 oligopeptide/dipeptide ABC transporter ATP-binding protein [Nocardioides albus]GGU14921.1 ABC transporter ATP-binding protein [Nocardioides albus]
MSALQKGPDEAAGGERRAPLLELRQVSVRYPVGGRRRLTAVDAVDLRVHEGETLGIIGESGSGKSTIARAVLGLAPVSSGKLLWQGEDVSGFDRAQRREFVQAVQMVFQDPHSALDPRRTIAQSVREPLDVMRRGVRGSRQEVAMQALADVGLTAEIAGRYPHQLSGGQKQRANIARALVTRPRLLICDESVAALDVALQAEILNLLQDLKVNYQLTIMFISHDLSVVAHLADRMNVVYLGQVVEDATTTSMVDQPRHPYSEALLSAQPHVNLHEETNRIVLTGDIPSPLDPPPGCRFHTRCQHAIDRCATTTPELTEALPDHWAACLRTEELYGLTGRAKELI